MTAVKLPKTLPLTLLFGLISLLATAPAPASDNSKSTLEVFKLLAAAGSKSINAVPPPIDIRPKPPSLQLLKQQLASQQQILAEQEAGLAAAEDQLDFWQKQPAEVAAINVPRYINAVAADQHLVATVQTQINQLLKQIPPGP